MYILLYILQSKCAKPQAESSCRYETSLGYKLSLQQVLSN